MTMVETYLFLGSRARVLLDGSATGGLFGLIEFTEAVGSQTPPHLHLTDTEIIYVLSGRTRVETEGQAFDLLPGSAHVLRPGRSHRLSIPEVETRHLVLVTPGAFVDFVCAVGIAADASTPLRHPTSDEIARVRDVAGAYGIELLPEDSLQAANARLNDQQAPDHEKNEEAAGSTELSFAVADRQITLERLDPRQPVADEGGDTEPVKQRPTEEPGEQEEHQHPEHVSHVEGEAERGRRGAIVDDPGSLRTRYEGQAAMHAKAEEQRERSQRVETVQALTGRLGSGFMAPLPGEALGRLLIRR